MAYNLTSHPKTHKQELVHETNNRAHGDLQLPKNIFAIIDAESVPCHARSTQMR
jgi:hypothetical protein